MTNTRLLAAALASVLLLAGCSVPTDESAQVLDPELLPEALQPGFTTTTSTTIPQSQEVTIYLLRLPPDQEQKKVVPRAREVERDPTLEERLTNLFGEGRVSDEEAELGYTNPLFEFALLGARVDDGVATIDIALIDPLTGEVSDEDIGRALLRDVAAQLVWTATEVDEVDDQVIILIAGEEIELPTSEEDTELGAVVGRLDFERYDPEFAPDAEPTTSTTSTVAPTTTTAAPPTSSEPAG